MTDQFLKLLHSGTVNAENITDKDRRALLALIKKSLKQRGGGGGGNSMRLSHSGNRRDSSSSSSCIVYSRSGVRDFGKRAFTPASAGVK
jgi:hypothetical protein